ncbi:MAG: hypothetical protein IT198_17390 [Acidimicrobiia bacterium]|nr:hypothetical protein [Acidimicrobiia bacterium]
MPDAEVPEENDDREDAAGDEVADAREQSARRLSRLFPRLDAFAGIQRQLAGLDFLALTAARRSISQFTAFKIPQIVAAQDTIAKHFAQSIDFSHLTESYRQVMVAARETQGLGVQTRWAEALSKSIDSSAITDALASTAAITELTEANTAIARSLLQQTEMLSRITEGLAFKVPTIDFAALIAASDRWIPINLHGVDDLDAVATIALEEGLPLSWVPRTEIVVAIIEAPDSEARCGILDARLHDVLDDCEIALTEIAHEWGEQCRAAIMALRAGFEAPAQSHASNIVDSLVLARYGKNGRGHATERAQEEFDDLPLQLAAENLTLRPLFRALTGWWPHTGTEPPEHFARHATSHAVGHVGVFTPRSALIAVMLATSLTVEYAPRGSEPENEADPSES